MKNVVRDAVSTTFELSADTIRPLLPTQMEVIGERWDRHSECDPVTPIETLGALAFGLYCEIAAGALDITMFEAGQLILQSPELQTGIVVVSGIITEMGDFPEDVAFPFSQASLRAAFIVAQGSRTAGEILQSILSGIVWCMGGSESGDNNHADRTGSFTGSFAPVSLPRRKTGRRRHAPSSTGRRSGR